MRLSPEKRYRLMAAVSLYAGVLGACAIVISYVSRQRLHAPLWEPEHLQLHTSLFLGMAGLIAGVSVASILIYWLIGKTNFAQHPMSWVAVAVGYAIMAPFVTGALMPFSAVFLNLYLGIFDISHMPSALTDAVFRSPHGVFAYGSLALGTTALAALMFAPGAWLIDTVNASERVIVGRYGTIGVTLGLSSAVGAFALFGPPFILVKLG